jgi:hypothetical protein
MSLLLKAAERKHEHEITGAALNKHLPLWFRIKIWLPLRIVRRRAMMDELIQVAAEEIIQLRKRVAELEAELAKLKG